MVWALIFVVVTSAMVVSHSAYMASHRQAMDVHLQRKPLASSFARAGLTDALSWFQAQPTQPVTAFAPVNDPFGDPPVVDTIDPTVGLVRAFEIRGNLWGRYEIRKSEVVDRSKDYGLSSPGNVWEVAARAYVYRVVDPNRPFDQPPNTMVSSSRMTTSIRGVPVSLPAQAAVSVDAPSLLGVLSGGKVIGGGSNPGVAFEDPGGVLPLLPLGISGTPLSVALGLYKPSPTDVFGMTLAELRDVADLMVVNAGTELERLDPREQPVIFVDGDLTVANRLEFAGLLVVDGNLVFLPDNDSFIRGVVYVTGNTDITGAFTLLGSLVGRGSVQIAGNGTGKDAVIKYDAGVIARLTAELRRYRQARALKPMRYESDTGDGSSTDAGTIDPTATIATTAQIGAGVTIGYMSQVGGSAVIGDGVFIGRNVDVRSGAWIGGGAGVDDGAVVDVGARIGAFAKIAAGAVIGANAVIEEGAQIGAGATVSPGATVPANAIVAAGTTF